MPFDKCKRVCQYLSSGHQRLIYKLKGQLQICKKKTTKNLMLAIWLTQNNQLVGVNHATRIH